MVIKMDNYLTISNKLLFNKIKNINNITNNHNLILKDNEIINLIDNKNKILKELGRFEIEDILDKIILTFYNSVYIDKYNYYDTIYELVDIFYYYQKELDNKLSDTEILEYMKESFDGICGGSIKLLSSLSLDNLKRNIYE